MTGPRRSDLRGVLQDAVDDRISFVDANGAGSPEAARARDEIARYRALADLYGSGERVRLDDARRADLRLAATRALSWRDGLLDAYAHVPADPYVRRIRADIRRARAVLDACGGPFSDPFAGAKSVTLEEIERRDLGTRVFEETVDGRTVRRVAENGKPLGRVEVDVDGTVRVILADDVTVNRPFRDAAHAQEWLLARYSDNLLFSWRRLSGEDVDGEEPEDDATPGPRA